MKRNWLLLTLLILGTISICSACSISIDWGNQPSETTAPPVATEPPAGLPNETASPATEAPPDIGEPPIQQLRVAYIDTARNLFCWVDGGTSTQLTTTADVSDAAISPDGQLVAFTRTSYDWMHASIWVIGCDGTGGRILVSEDIFNSMNKPDGAISTVPMQMDWIPGTHMLVYNTYPTFEGPGLMPNEDLWYTDADTGSNSAVLTAGYGGYYYISPDGSKLALVRPDSISLMNSDTTNLMQNIFYYTGMPTYSEYAYHADPAWSPDSTYLRVAIPMSDPLAGTAQSITVYQIPADGSASFVVGYFNALSFTGLTFSPDLSKVAYMLPYGEPANNMRTLRVANVDGSGDIEIITDQLDLQGWNPNNYDLVYSLWSNSYTYITNIDHNTQQLANHPTADRIQWVDGSRFLYMVNDGANWQLYLGTLGAGPYWIATLPITDTGYNPSYSFAD